MHEHGTYWSKSGNLAVIALFYIGLWLPVLGMIFGLDKTEPLRENRVKAKLPQLHMNLSSINEFPAGFGSYYDDNFGFRDLLVNTHHRFLLRGLNTPPNKNLLIGEEEWTYLKVAPRRNALPLPDQKLEDLEKKLLDIKVWAESQGSRFYFLVVPDKHTIYPEYLPWNVRYYTERSRYNRFAKYLSDRQSELEIIYPREAMLANKSLDHLYFKTDSHWATPGEHIAYQVLENRITKDFPIYADTPLPPTKTKRINIELPQSRLFTYPGAFREDVTQHTLTEPQAIQVEFKNRSTPHSRYIHSHIPGSEFPSMVVIHDSFLANHRLSSKYLRERSSEFFGIQYRQDGDMAEILIKARELVTANEPDIVILEIVERNLETVIDWPDIAELFSNNDSTPAEQRRTHLSKNQFNQFCNAPEDPFAERIRLHPNEIGQPDPEVIYHELNVAGVSSISTKGWTDSEGIGAILKIRVLDLDGEVIFQREWTMVPGQGKDVTIPLPDDLTACHIALSVSNVPEATTHFNSGVHLRAWERIR